MNIQQRADAIVRATLNQSARHRMRSQPVGLVEQQDAECVGRVTDLLSNEMGGRELALYAAVATFRANFAELQAEQWLSMLHEMIGELEMIETGSMGNVADAKAALEALRARGGLIAAAVGHAQSMGKKLTASAGGTKGTAKYRDVKAFAMNLYNARQWDNPHQAAGTIWSAVQAEAVRLGRPMSEERGPKTLYLWLLAHKTDRSTG